MRWVIDQRTALPAYIEAVLTHGRQVAGDTLQLLPTTTHSGCDVFVQPHPFVNDPAPLAHFFQPEVRRWAYVETWPLPTRTNMAHFVWLKRYHTIVTPNVATGQRLLANADLRWQPPEETWRTFAPHAAAPQPQPHIVFVATLTMDAMGYVFALQRMARVEYISDHTPTSIHQAAQPCDLRLFLVADGAEHAWVYELARRLGGVLLLHGEGLGHMWHERYGLAATATLAGRELGRPVSMGEMLTWLQEPHTCPVRLLNGAERTTWLCSPLSATGRSALPLAATDLSPQPPFRSGAGERESEYRKSTRILLHAPMPEAIQALDLLVSWGFPFQAIWYGKMPKPLRRLARRYGVRHHIAECRHKALALVAHDDVDVALFWRPFARGGVADEISIFQHHGVPTVCADAEARLFGSPAFLRTVPDRLSPLLIAEAIVDAASWPHANVKAACLEHQLANTADAVAARILRTLGLHG